MPEHTTTVVTTAEQEQALNTFIDSHVLDNDEQGNPIRYASIADWLAAVLESTVASVLRRIPTTAIRIQRDKIEAAEAEIERLQRVQTQTTRTTTH